jgi:DNA-binding GntR family transcriptional regulator
MMRRMTTPTRATATLPRSKLAEQAYAQLKAQLHDFQLVPGERFAEADIATRLGMSRTPLREALFRLRNEGFLEVEAKAGWFVKPIDFGRIEQLYDLRIVLELASLDRLGRRTASEADPPQLQALKDIWLVPAAERLCDGRLVGQFDEQFHAQLVAAAGNEEIARVHHDVTERIRIVRRLDFTRADRIEATYQEHAKILRAVMQRRTEQAQLLLKSHIDQSKAEVKKITLHALTLARGTA